VIAHFTSLLASCCLIAWQNLTQHVTRTLSALMGTTVAVFLLLLQVQLLESVQTKATQIYDLFDFDLVVVSNTYQFMYAAEPFNAVRLAQARVDDAVADVFALNIRVTDWFSEQTGKESSLLLFGIDLKPGFIEDNALRRALPLLRRRGAVAIDAFSHSDYGPLSVGSVGWIRGKEVHVVAPFELGMFFFADGSAVISNDFFPNFASRSYLETSVGMIRLKRGASITRAKRRLQRTLPRDVLVFTRDELISQEQKYFVSVKPIGIMVRAGMVIAFVVGGAILFQVLSTEITSRLNEFATFKAIGFGPVFLYGIGVVQILLFALVGFVLAGFASVGVSTVIRNVIHLPMSLEPRLIAAVFGVTLLMCVVPGFVTLRRVRLADPAELY
jgi:putative ABC transport system permease protein